jgi:hypothetical protein
MKGAKGMKHGAKSGPSATKARAILHDGEVMGKPLPMKGKAHERGEGRRERNAEYGSPTGGMGTPSRRRK